MTTPLAPDFNLMALLHKMFNPRQWLCAQCGAVRTDDELQRIANAFAANGEPDEVIFSCPDCGQYTNGFYLICDEPDCNALWDVGWPTGNRQDVWGGYRHTCRNHWKPGPVLS